MASVYKPKGRNVFRIKFKDQFGNVRKISSHLKDKRLAERLGEMLEEDAERLRVGLPHKHGAISEVHLGLVKIERKETVRKWDDAARRFQAEVVRRNGGRSRYEQDVRVKLARIKKECGWETLSEVSSSRFLDFLNRLGSDGRSPTTLNQYLFRAQDFLKWCSEQGWIAESPLRMIKPTKAGEGLRRRLRRPFSEEELQKLCAVATSGRRMVYLVAAFSGFRRSELLRLRKEDCTPTGDNPRWHVRGDRTKNRKSVFLPMTMECAEALREHWLRLAPGSPLFPRGHDLDDYSFACGVPTNRSLRRDRIAAGIPHQDERGRFVDFHSFRYTFCLLLSRIYPIEVNSRFMRHSTIKLTSDTYLDLGIDREEAGAWKVPPLVAGGFFGPANGPAVVKIEEFRGKNVPC